LKATSASGFHKSVGIIFLEEMNPITKGRTIIRRSAQGLKFDQTACAHLLLQMNKVQGIFDFQVITLDKKDNFNLATTSVNPQYFDNEISKMKNTGNSKFQGIDYWIGVSSKGITQGYFLLAPKSTSTVGKLNEKVAIVTSKDWDREFSPPSLFEYIAMSVLICSLYLISYDFNADLTPHKTKSCIFDFTRDKIQRRILVSNPILCTTCRNTLSILEKNIQTKTGIQIALINDIEDLLNREWMGSPEKRDSPLYNLKKLYKYDVDRNSGFYKNWTEKFSEAIVDRLAEWTVGNVAGGIIGGLIAILFIVIFGIKP
jgi:hypothetical protein